MKKIYSQAPKFGYVEPLQYESISHYLSRLRLKNYLPSAYALGKAAGIGGVVARWEKLYFNPFPTEEELESIASLIGLDLSRFQDMLPSREKTFQPRPIRLCGVCYEVSATTCDYWSDVHSARNRLRFRHYGLTIDVVTVICGSQR
jgi:hypothetical protein